MATTLDERRQKTTPRPAAAMDLGTVDGAAPLNLTPPGTMRPDAPPPIQTQPAPKFVRTIAGPMVQQPPVPAPVAPTVDPQQQRLANQSAMYVQGAQAAAAARPQTPAQQMVDAPMSAPVRNSINAAVANPQPSLGATVDTRPRLFDPATARPMGAAPVATAAPAAAPRPAAQEMAQAPVMATGTEAELLRLQGVPVQDPNSGSVWRSLGNALMFSSDKQAMQDKARQVNYGNEGRRTPMPAVPAAAAAVAQGQRGTLEAQAKNPASDQGQVPGAAKPMPQSAQPEVGPPSGYTNTRVDGVYRKGNTFTDEAGTRDTAFQNRGPVSAQNMQAADQLAANYNSNQQALARFQAANPAPQPAQAAAPRQFDRAASIRALSDLRSPEAIALRNLRIDAQEEARDSARMGRAGRGNNAAGQAYAALMAELTTGTRQGQVAEMQDGTNRYTADRREEGATQRALMGEEGATRRAGMTNEVQQGELGLKREAQSLTNQAAQRLQKAQDDYLNETDPAKREAKARTLQALMGKGDGAPAGKDRYITMGGGQEYDPKGGLINRPQEVFDTVTGQRVGAAAAPAPLPPKDKLVVGTAYDTPRGRATWNGSAFIPVQ